MNLELTKEELRSRLKAGVWIVEFTKVSGDKSAMECTLDSKLLPAPDEFKVVTTRRDEPEHLLQVYSTDRQGWRSFVVANVHSFYRKPENL